MGGWVWVCYVYIIIIYVLYIYIYIYTYIHTYIHTYIYIILKQLIRCCVLHIWILFVHFKPKIQWTRSITLCLSFTVCHVTASTQFGCIAGHLISFVITNSLCSPKDSRVSWLIFIDVYGIYLKETVLLRDIKGK